MRWRRVLSIAGWFGGGFGLLLFIFGVPGHIDDTVTWLKWSKASGASIALLLTSVGLLLSGPLLWTSGWWYPRLHQSWNGGRKASIALTESNEDLIRFRSCLPHVERCRSLIRPYTGTIGVPSIALTIFQGGSDVFAEIATELEYLTQQLSVVGIHSPDIWGEEGNDSLDKVHERLRTWSRHLARLEAKIHQGDLEGARFNSRDD